MRTIFFAQSDDAVRLAASLGCGLLIGGMSAETVAAQIQAFEDDPDAMLVATAAFDQGWRSSIEAHVFFLVGFPGSMLSAIDRVREPSVLPPTVDQLKQHTQGDITLSPASLLTLLRGGADELDVALSSDDTPALPAPQNDGAGIDVSMWTDREEYEHFDSLEANDVEAFCPAPRREQDEYVCDQCHKRWDVNDNRPICDVVKGDK